MDFAANTHVIASAGRTLATVESGPLPYELTDELDTVGPCDFSGTLPGGFAAHTKADPVTGDLHAIAYYWAWDHVQHLVVGSGGRVASATNIPVADGPMMHDFALTGPVRGAVRPAGHLQHGRRVRREEAALHLESGHQARVGLLPRDGSPGDVRWFEVNPCWVFHTFNAYDDDGGRVVVDLCRYPGAYDVSALGGRGPLTLDRWIVDPAAGKVTEQRLDDRCQEFPRVDDRVISRPHRYGYSAVIGEVSQGTDGRWAATSRTRPSPMRCSSTTWPTAPPRRMSSAATPPRARRCSRPPDLAPTRTTATSWRSCTTPTAVPPTWSSWPPRTSPGTRHPGAPARPDPARVPRQLDRRPLGPRRPRRPPGRGRLAAGPGTPGLDAPGDAG